SRDTRVCSYDRAGYGWSDEAPSPRSARAVAEDLEELLRMGGVRSPLVLVGHSLGGIYVRQFAALHLSDVSAMVLVDSSHEDQGAGTGVQAFVWLGNMVGLRRFFVRFDDPLMGRVYNANKNLRAAQQEIAGVEKSARELKEAALSLGHRP